MKRSFNKKNFGQITVMITSLLLVSVMACNKPFENTLQEDDKNPPAFQKAIPKTLLIVIDGALGAQVKDIRPPALSQLADFSLFSWDALADTINTEMTNATGWSNLLTGVYSDKHKVAGADFSGNQLVDYPAIFTRLKAERPNWRSSAFCSSPDILTYLAVDATEKMAFANDDAAVKDAVISELKTKDAAFVLAQFHEVDLAGSAGAYKATDPNYRNAVLKIDGYIDELIATVRTRPSFKDENWMIIISSNKGNNVPDDPVGAQRNAFSDSRRNTLFFCYNPRFVSHDLLKPAVFPYVASAPLMTDDAARKIRGRVRTGGTTYDIGSTGDFTIECKVKIPPGNYYYPPILSKRASFSTGVVGWLFFLEADYWQINFGQIGFNSNRQIRGSKVSDGQWHTLTAVIKQEGAARNVYTYTDGVLYPFIGDRNIASYGNLNSKADLTMGLLTSGSSLRDYLVTDIKIYNTALPASFIAGNYCRTSISDNNPYKANLLGYWPCTNLEEGKLADLSGKNNPFILEGNYGTSSFSDASGMLCPDPVYAVVPAAVDVPVQIYQWFGIIVPPAWSLDGKNWIPRYTDVAN
jgi:hypothetical protein